MTVHTHTLVQRSDSARRVRKRTPPRPSFLARNDGRGGVRLRTRESWNHFRDLRLWRPRFLGQPESQFAANASSEPCQERQSCFGSYLARDTLDSKGVVFAPHTCYR